MNSVFKNYFGNSKKLEKNEDNSSISFADELHQIQDDYEQGFLSQDEYVFLTGLYKKWSNIDLYNSKLHVVEKGSFGDEDLYNISRKVGEFISNLFTIDNEFDQNFYWLKYAATRPFFHHLCFTYKKTVYSCLIGVVLEDGEIWVSPQDAEIFFRETLSNCLYPCIIPVTQSGEIYDKVFPILDAETLHPIDFDKEEEFISSVMTKYELYARALNEVAVNLVNQGCTKISTCDMMSITPSIWFKDENGQHSYIVVRSVPAGQDEWSYRFNKGVADYYKDDKGYFVNLLWNNLRGNKGDFRDIQIWKNGSYVHNKIELEPLDYMEIIEINHPHFDFVSEVLYSVQANEKPTAQDGVWDSSLEKISKQEKIRYKIYKRFGELKSGESLDLESVFGKDGISTDEYLEFLKVATKLSNPVPLYETPEELQEAESNVKEDDADTMCRIANTYVANGNFEEAVKWYSAAADLGNGEAMCRIGSAYKYGAGVEQDMNKAILFCKKAIATDGNADALLDLGLCYLKGEGVPLNYDHGFFLMERSAKQGNMAAQYNMGVLYRTGRGVDANMEEALRWYRLSAAQGYDQAIDFLNQYENYN